MDRDYETLRVDDRGEGLLLLTLNRPEVANALNTQMGRDLLAFFDAINAMPGNQRCIVVTGAGERAFCAGGDLKERNGMTDESWRSQHLIFERMVRAMMGCPIPLVAAVNGALKTAAHGAMKGILGYTEEELVSSDFKGNPNSSIVDAGYTKVVGDRCVKVLAWYDNEWGYSCRCRDLIKFMAAKF